MVLRRKKVELCDMYMYFAQKRKERSLLGALCMQSCQYIVSKISAAESPVDILLSIAWLSAIILDFFVKNLSL